jgi:hypothetical protein
LARHLQKLAGAVQTDGLEDKTMLWTILVILLVLWVLGFLVFHVAGGLIHLLLVIAAIVLVVRLVQGKRVI